MAKISGNALKDVKKIQESESRCNLFLQKFGILVLFYNIVQYGKKVTDFSCFACNFLIMELVVWVGGGDFRIRI